MINLGTGNGCTVRELVDAFEHVYGESLPQKDMPPRPGDQGGAYANCDRAKRVDRLGGEVIDRRWHFGCLEMGEEAQRDPGIRVIDSDDSQHLPF